MITKIVFSVIVMIVGIIFIFAYIPEYEVGKAHLTGKCQWVEKKGKRVSDGCKQVESGAIKRYSTTWVY